MRAGWAISAILAMICALSCFGNLLIINEPFWPTGAGWLAAMLMSLNTAWTSFCAGSKA